MAQPLRMRLFEKYHLCSKTKHKVKSSQAVEYIKIQPDPNYLPTWRNTVSIIFVKSFAQRGGSNFW